MNYMVKSLRPKDYPGCCYSLARHRQKLVDLPSKVIKEGVILEENLEGLVLRLGQWIGEHGLVLLESRGVNILRCVRKSQLGHQHILILQGWVGSPRLSCQATTPPRRTSARHGPRNPERWPCSDQWGLKRQTDTVLQRARDVRDGYGDISHTFPCGSVEATYPGPLPGTTTSATVLCESSTALPAHLLGGVLKTPSCSGNRAAISASSSIGSTDKGTIYLLVNQNVIEVLFSCPDKQLNMIQ